MPVWHEATRELRESGKIQLVGIVQEQHGERARLFAQWKQFDWPILVDSLNLLEVGVVPLVLVLDEHGVVRSILKDPKRDLPLLHKAIGRSIEPPPSPTTEPLDDHRAALGKALNLCYFTEPPELSEAIQALKLRTVETPADGRLHFALGVIHRARFDSANRQKGDFQEAIDRWQNALDLNPNQYIWRRRIQQYGPRLEKPYPFYDWIDQARREILARGEVPVALAVEPAGSELAKPVKASVDGDKPVPNPDPEGRITRDSELIDAEAVVVPPRARPGGSVRAYISFRPNAATDTHWNNESEPMQVYVDLPMAWSASPRLIALPPPPQAVTNETRTVEFELGAPKNATGSGQIRAFAIFHACRGQSGECLFRRKDIDVAIEVQQPQP